MNNKWLWAVGLLCMLFAGVMLWLGAGSAAVQAQGPDTFPGEPLPVDRGEWFSGSGACTSCHSSMVDDDGVDVSIDTAWRSTMMANAARDPYWQVSVRLETLITPQLAGVIEDKCATCHMPMARTTAALQGELGLMLDDGFLNPDHPLHALAMDGNSCTLCHQIEPDTLGEEASFSGEFVIDPDYPAGERPSYSRFEVADNYSMVMQAASGFVPLKSEHISEAVLCATCHTLYTPYVDGTGEIAGTFPEQMPFMEWLHGGFAEVQPCQGCHMPRARGAVVTSVTGGEPRSPFFTHIFVGGNAYMQNVFMAFGDEMGATASYDHFAATHEQVLDQLQNRTAILAIPEATLDGPQLDAQVQIRVLTGHKFPAGFPSRRAFLHVTVTDASGAVVFESGAYEPDGRVLGDDHDADPLRFEPHYTVITAPDQVQIYESVMMDYAGRPTTVLLHGAGYIKNNRLLPNGFDKTTAWDDIAVRGAALVDPDFTGGGDRVRYVIDVGEAEGPFTIEAELMYLSIGYNWAQKARGYDVPEAVRFLAYYDAVPNTPVQVAAVSAQVE